MTDSALALSQPSRSWVTQFDPNITYIVVVGLFYVAIAAFTALGPLSAWAPNRDLWQHLAVLGALIDNPENPRNPFVDTMESSRSFGPVWLALAYLARWVGWTPTQALSAGAVVNLTLLAAAIHCFARVCLPTRWGPLALFLAMSFGWLFPVLHTGFHSVPTLVEGAAYPAVTMIAGSLLVWALSAQIARGYAVLRDAAILSILLALLFANHQLGTGIALIGAGCFAVFAPAVALRHRGALITAILAGLALSQLWPYHNPFDVLSDVSNPRWNATSDFFSGLAIVALLVPSGFGIWGFWLARNWQFARPLAASTAIFAALFLMGMSPSFPIGHRFAMPMVLVLHVGLAVLILAVAKVDGAPSLGSLPQRIFRRFLPYTAIVGMVFTAFFIRDAVLQRTEYGDLALAVARLLPEPRSDTGIAGRGVASWPIVASGRRTLSVPWPEPLIHDLPQRQDAARALFDPRTHNAERRAIAERWGIHSLVVDSRIVVPGVIQALRRERLPERCAATLIRFDLVPTTTPPDPTTLGPGACRVVNHFVRNPITNY